MRSHGTADGKRLTANCLLRMGEPAVQRMVMEFDEHGAPKSAISHSMPGCRRSVRQHPRQLPPQVLIARHKFPVSPRPHAGRID